MITERITDKISIVICEGRKYSADIEKTESVFGKSFLFEIIEMADKERKIDRFLFMTNHIDMAALNNSHK